VLCNRKRTDFGHVHTVSCVKETTELSRPLLLFRLGAPDSQLPRHERGSGQARVRFEIPDS
jgi:hypothetical protein